MVNRVFLVSGKRTPFGKFGGTLAGITPGDLAVHCSKALLEKTKVTPDQIDQVFVGNVLTSTPDTFYASRHLALKLGMPQSTPAMNINRLCGSGIQAIIEAIQLIKLGEGHCYLASGTENMSMAPHLVYGSRFGTKYGALKTADMLLDALTDQYTGISMGLTAEALGDQVGVTRDQCDQFAYESHQKAQAAYQKKYFDAELSPVIDEKLRVNLIQDEHVRFEMPKADLTKLKSTFKKEGLVTAASASGIVDGAASVLVASEAFCQKHGITPLAEIVDSVVVGVDPKIMGVGPVPATEKLLEKHKLTMSQIDHLEINEAFGAQALACLKLLKRDQKDTNRWGGAIALGHPLGATGVRITLTLAEQMKALGGKLGVATACIGGGQGIAILLKKV